MKLLTLNLKVNRSIIACPKHSFFPWIGWRIYSNFPCLWCQLHSSKNQHVDRRKRNSHFSATGSSRIHSHQFTAKSGNIALSSVDDQSDLGLRIVVALLILIMHGQCFDHEILCHQNGSNILCWTVVCLRMKLSVVLQFTIRSSSVLLYIHRDRKH